MPSLDLLISLVWGTAWEWDFKKGSRWLSSSAKVKNHRSDPELPTRPSGQVTWR